MSSVVSAVDSAETGRPSQIWAIFTMCGSKSASLPPVLAKRLGLVVTPEMTPQLWASRISSRLAVSMKNFMVPPSVSMCCTVVALAATAPLVAI